MDDRRVGLIIRALRRRRAWRQSDLASRSGVSQPTVSFAERGHFKTLSIRTVRRILAALDARADLDIRWRGGNLDRTLDERHARLVGAVVATLGDAAWLSEIEVTYAIYGERGSIDVLSFHPPTAALLVVEVKTELASIEETLRRLDE
jgi:transcriptional regulator with XRE-family HTH domain